MATRRRLSEREPRKVQSVVCTKFGGYDKIKIEKVPLHPIIYTDSWLEVEVNYCGVNFADIYMRQGLIQSLKPPFIMGLECVGVVTDVGPRVRSFLIGQRVLCYNGNGGLYREKVIVDEKFCFAVPAFMRDEVAVTIPANYLTAYFCLFEISTLLPSQRILIHSCAGGVGWALTQLARTVPNVEIVGTASEAKHGEVRNNGVDYPIDSKNYLDSLRDNSDIRDPMFDLIIDSIGGANIMESLSMLNPCGKVVVIGANHIINNEHKLSHSQVLKSWWSTKNIHVRDLIENNWSISGLHLARVMEDCPAKVHNAFDRIVEFINERVLCPRIDLVVDFHDIVSGMRALSNRENVGKVVVRVTRKPTAEIGRALLLSSNVAFREVKWDSSTASTSSS